MKIEIGSNLVGAVFIVCVALVLIAFGLMKEIAVIVQLLN